MVSAPPHPIASRAYGAEEKRSVSRPTAYIKLTRWEISFGVVGIFAWIGLLSAGLIVGSAPYRAALGDPTRLTLAEVLKNGGMALISYTVSNVATLCCLSALLGALGHRARISGDEVNDPKDAFRSLYVSALLRGFFIFLALMTGVVILGNIDYNSAKPSDYGHLAGAASLFSFLIGRDPHLFANLIARVKDWSDTQQKGASTRLNASGMEMQAEQKVDRYTHSETDVHTRTHIKTDANPELHGKAIVKVRNVHAANGSKEQEAAKNLRYRSENRA